MVQRLFVIILLVLICFHTAMAQPVVIHAKLDNINNNQPVFIYRLFGPESLKVDSTIAIDGLFSFQYPDSLPRGFYKIGVDENKSVTLILGRESFNMEGDLSQPLSIQYKNSAENKLFKEFAAFNRHMQMTNQKIIQKAQIISISGEKDKESNHFQNQIDSLKREQAIFYQKLSEENPGLLISKIVRTFILRTDLSKETFFSAEELSDIEFTRGDMLLGKINQYYQRYVPRNIEGWLAAADQLVAKTKAGSAHREVIYLSLISLFMKGAPDNLWDVADKYGNDFPQSKHYLDLVSTLPPPAPRVGEQAPDIILPDQHGVIQKLSALRGSYVLVDFWASWCGPCRRENPNVVRAYLKFKKYGFKVLGVSLDHNKEKWLAAIEKDQLMWGHISDLKGWKSEGAAKYQVRSIPASFLVDPQGKIIAKNLRGPVLDSTLEKLLINASKN